MNFGMVPTRYTFLRELLVLWWFRTDGWYKHVITTPVESFTHLVRRKRGRTLNVFLLYYCLNCLEICKPRLHIDILHHLDTVDDSWAEKMHTLFISPLQMSTIWADTVDQARSAARDFVFAGLSDRGDLYGLFDCWYDYDRVKVKNDSTRSQNLCCPRPLLWGLEILSFTVSPISSPLCSLIFSWRSNTCPCVYCRQWILRHWKLWIAAMSVHLRWVTLGKRKQKTIVSNSVAFWPYVQLTANRTKKCMCYG